MRLRLSAVPIAAAAATACVPQVAPQSAPTPLPTRVVLQAAPQPVAQPISDDWRDWPATPGTWTYRRDARGGLALFGPAGSDALVSLRCDRAAGRLYLSRAGSVAEPLTIRTTSMVRVVAMQPTGGTPLYVAVALAPDDRLLDAMAFSRGHFTMEAIGQQAAAQPAPGTLVIPAWAEVGRVIEDCRG